MNLKTLIERGYFPRELPPPFTTKYFADFYDKSSSKLPKVVENSRGVLYSCPKLGLARKTLIVTNPQHQTELFKFINDNWKDILKEFKKTKVSYSVPTNGKGDRAANPKKYGEFKRECFKKSFYHRYQLIADISKYYPTIYTHSIPWAIHGKDFSKKHKGVKNLGNELDRLVRNTQSAQTIGLPMGPDSSLIISELIGVELDSRLSNVIKDLVGHRYVDDMNYFFKSFAEAEYCLKEIRNIFNHFELKINTEKTKIISLPVGIEEEWVIQLRKFEFAEKGTKQYYDIISFFSLAFNFSKKFKDEFVLTYAIRKLKDTRISKDNFPLYESMLYKTIQTESSTLSEVLPILLGYRKWVNKTKLKKALTELIRFSTPRAYDFELSWSLWYAKTFEISFNKSDAKLLSKMKDPVALLVVLDLINSGLLDKVAFNSKYWKKTIDEDFLWDENWIFAYEITVKRWGFRKFDYIDKSPKNRYYKVLKDNDVIFYDDNLQVKTLGDLTKPKKPKADKKGVTDKGDIIKYTY